MSEELMRLRYENQQLRVKIAGLEEVAEMMSCLEAAGIDNCEAYAIGMREFHKRRDVDVEVVDEKPQLCTGTYQLEQKASKEKRVPKDKSDK